MVDTKIHQTNKNSTKCYKWKIGESDSCEDLAQTQTGCTGDRQSPQSAFEQNLSKFRLLKVKHLAKKWYKMANTR